MAEKKETYKEPYKVKDIKDSVKSSNGMVRENYLNSLNLAFSIWEENVKVVNAQVDQLLSARDEYSKSVKEFYSKLPKELFPFDGEGPKTLEEGTDRVVNFQNEYIDSVRGISDKFAKEARSLTQKNVEKAFSLVDEYLNAFKI